MYLRACVLCPDSGVGKSLKRKPQESIPVFALNNNLPCQDLVESTLTQTLRLPMHETRGVQTFVLYHSKLL